MIILNFFKEDYYVQKIGLYVFLVLFLGLALTNSTSAELIG